MATHTQDTARKAKNEAGRQIRRASQAPWVQSLTRLGYAVRGIIYGLIGFFAIQVALGGSHGKLTDQQGVIATIGAQPLGRFFLVIIAIGLAGYALWGFIRAVADPLHKGSDTKGIIARIGYLISGISYGALFVPTLNTLRSRPGGAAAGGSASSTQSAAANIMTKPWGPWLIGAIGLGMIAAAIVQIRMGWDAKFDMQFNSYAMSAEQRRWATRLGRFGYIARGIVFAIVGIFLFQAALYNNPSKATSINGALVAVASQPYGTVLLAIIAAGLIAFGIYSLAGSIWFRIKK